MVKFCSECGSKVEYKFNPPKFCSNCGSPIGAAVAASQEQEPPPPMEQVGRMRKKIKAVSDSETDAEHVPQLTRLEFEIDSYASHQDTIGSLLGNRPPSRRVKRNIQRLDDKMIDRDLRNG